MNISFNKLNYSLFIFFLFTFSLKVQGQEDTTTSVKKDTTEIKDSASHKPVFVFQIDQRNSFLGSKYVSVNGIYVGLNYSNKMQYSVGFYTLSPWKIYKPFVVNDSTSEISRFNLYFISFCVNPYLYNSKNNKFKISLPLELGFGFTKAKQIEYIYQQQLKSVQIIDFIPAQAGIYFEYKLTRWVGINGSVGYRKLLFKDLFPSGTSYNYDAPYYNFGTNMYFDVIFKDVRKWRKRIAVEQNTYTTKNRLSIKSGAAYSRLMDNFISIFVYDKLIIPLSLQYYHMGDKLYSSGSASFFKTTFSTTTNEGFVYANSKGPYYTTSVNNLQNKVPTTYFNLSYNLAKNLVLKKRLKIYGGAELSYSLFNKDFIIVKYSNTLNEQFTSLNAFAVLNYRLSTKDHVHITVSSPLLCYFVKDHAITKVIYDRYQNFVTVNHYAGITTSIDYSFLLTKSLSLDLNYIFYYYQYNIPRKEQLGMNNLLLGINYNF